jgi:RNA polymerase-binding transcription factor DksA
MRDVSKKIREQLEARLQNLNQRIDEIEGDLRTAPSADFEEQTCGEPIGEQRLEALPYALQCINCARG